MRFPVEVISAKVGKQPKRRRVTCDFAHADDIEQLKTWGDQLPAGLPIETENKMRDAAEYAVLAADKWKFLKDLPATRVVHSAKELKASCVGASSQDEYAALLIARASWNNPTAMLGFCFFRRTWCNNIVIDFLATHPLVAGHNQILGIGRGLVYVTTTLAKQIDAKFVWGESTRLSYVTYQKWFHQTAIDDLFRIPGTAWQQFRSDTEDRWSSPSKGSSTAPSVDAAISS